MRKILSVMLLVTVMALGACAHKPAEGHDADRFEPGARRRCPRRMAPAANGAAGRGRGRRGQ